MKQNVSMDNKVFICLMSNVLILLFYNSFDAGTVFLFCRNLFYIPEKDGNKIISHSKNQCT